MVVVSNFRLKYIFSSESFVIVISVTELPMSNPVPFVFVSWIAPLKLRGRLVFSPPTTIAFHSESERLYVLTMSCTAFNVSPVG